MSEKGPRRRLVIGLAVVLFFVAIGGWFLYSNFFSSPIGRGVEVEIKKGESLTEIANTLAAKKVVKSAWLFIAVAKYKQVSTRIFPGSYKLREGMSYAEAIDVLRKGPVKKTFTVTIPEGFTIDQIATALRNKTEIDEEEFLRMAENESSSFSDYSFLQSNSTTSLEGYLFPKTYTVADKTTTYQFVTVLLNQFNKETSSLDWQAGASRGMSSHQIVTVASMVESEVKVPQERPLVSAVIYNRLSKGMPLRIDATVQYALGTHKAKLTAGDLKVNSPYNTYANKGLPPGPICNPSLASIQAALDPASVNYLYYVLTDPTTGRHTFTVTYEEFLRAKKQAK